MTPKIDAGGMIAVARTAIDPEETAGELEERLARFGAPLSLDAIERIVAGRAEILPQDQSLVTKAPKLKKEDGLIDWTRPAAAIHNLVRAMQPWPIASTTWTALPRTPAEPVRLIVHKTRPVAGEGEPGVVLTATKDELDRRRRSGGDPTADRPGSRQKADDRGGVLAWTARSARRSHGCLIQFRAMRDRILYTLDESTVSSGASTGADRTQ